MRPTGVSVPNYRILCFYAITHSKGKALESPLPGGNRDGIAEKTDSKGVGEVEQLLQYAAWYNGQIQKNSFPTSLPHGASAFRSEYFIQHLAPQKCNMSPKAVLQSYT